MSEEIDKVDKSEKPSGCFGTPWRTVGVIVLLIAALSPTGRIATLESKFRQTDSKLSELKKTIDKHQTQIDDLKRELEEMKRKE